MVETKALCWSVYSGAGDSTLPRAHACAISQGLVMDPISTVCQACYRGVCECGASDSMQPNTTCITRVSSAECMLMAHASARKQARKQACDKRAHRMRRPRESLASSRWVMPASWRGFLSDGFFIILE
jgi:hypothetical protein